MDVPDGIVYEIIEILKNLYDDEATVIVNQLQDIIDDEI